MSNKRSEAFNSFLFCPWLHLYGGEDAVKEVLILNLSKDDTLSKNLEDYYFKGSDYTSERKIYNEKYELESIKSICERATSSYNKKENHVKLNKNVNKMKRLLIELARTIISVKSKLSKEQYNTLKTSMKKFSDVTNSLVSSP